MEIISTGILCVIGGTMFGFYIGVPVGEWMEQKRRSDRIDSLRRSIEQLECDREFYEAALRGRIKARELNHANAE